HHVRRVDGGLPADGHPPEPVSIPVHLAGGRGAARSPARRLRRGDRHRLRYSVSARPNGLRAGGARPGPGHPGRPRLRGRPATGRHATGRAGCRLRCPGRRIHRHEQGAVAGASRRVVRDRVLGRHPRWFGEHPGHPHRGGYHRLGGRRGDRHRRTTDGLVGHLPGPHRHLALPPPGHPRAGDHVTGLRQRSWFAPGITLVVAGLAWFYPDLVDAAGWPIFYLLFAYTVFFWVAQASSWNLFTGFSGYFSFGQGAFYGVGLYAVGVLVVKQGWTLLPTFL